MAPQPQEHIVETGLELNVFISGNTALHTTMEGRNEMPRCLNKVMLIGHISEPKLTTSKRGMPICQFSLATNRYKKEADESFTEEVTWHRIITFSDQAKKIAELPKGTAMYVEGRINNREWVDEKDIKHYVTEIIPDNIIPLSKSERKTKPTDNDEPIPFEVQSQSIS